MAVVGTIEGFRIFIDHKAFNFKNLQITPKLLHISPNTFGIAFATSIGVVTVALRDTIDSFTYEANLTPHVQETIGKANKEKLKDDSLRCVMFFNCWTPN